LKEGKMMPFDMLGTVRTLTRPHIDLQRMSIEDISLVDIAHALSMQCRYNGHVPHFFSVAEHSVAVSRRLPEAHRAWGLFHDAAEAYVGDLISPIKHGLPDYQEIEAKILCVIAEKFKLSTHIPAIIHEADKAQLDREMCSLQGCWSSTPSNVSFWSPAVAKAEFIEAAGQLSIQD
jgi:5'-deoxynucleotidase YfbR-like HD superfamily hydrolase